MAAWSRWSVLFLFTCVVSVHSSKHVVPVPEKTYEEAYTPTVQVQQAREAYVDYKACVMEKSGQFRKGKEKAGLVLVEEGDTALLRCRICIKHKSYKSYMGKVQWMASLHINKYKEKPVFPNQKRIILLRNFNLAFRPVSVADAGEYVCFYKETHEALYRLDVLHKSVRRLAVESGAPDLKPLETIAVQSENLIVYSNWDEWATCSQCNHRGFRQRVGFCWVKKFHSDNPATNTEVEKLLQEYPKGFPCFSSLAPEAIRLMPEIKDRESETMMAYCQVPCSTAPAVKIFKNHLGQVEEVVKRGFFSMKEKMPTIPPVAKRYFSYADDGKNKVVICPNKKAHNRKVQIRWMIGYKEVDPLILLRQTQGRIRIDLRNRIRIKNFRLSDVNMYSCWLNDTLLAVVRVAITSGRIPKYYFDIMYAVSFSLAIGIMFAMMACFCMRRNAVKSMR